MEQKHICSITPTEFEEYCLEILKGYAETEDLKDFLITHNVKIPASDGKYQIDVYAEFTAMGAKFKVLCECKHYKSSVKRGKVAELHRKLESIGAQKAILISTSKFQSGAVEYANAHGIALIYVENYNFEYISHSSGEMVINDDDPFLYAEKHMPPYVAFNCSSNTEEPIKVYPPKSMIRKLIIEMNQQIKEKLGIDIDLPEIQE